MSVKKVPATSGFAKSIDVERLPMQSLLAQRVRDMVQDYEAFQSRLRGYKFVAVRTRQAIVRKGILNTVIGACKVRPSPGFRLMVEHDMAHQTYEWIALEFPKGIPKSALEAARKRLDTFEVKGYPGWKEEKPTPKAKAKAKGTLELQPIPAGAQAILDEAKERTHVKAKANYKEIVPPQPTVAEQVHALHPKGKSKRVSTVKGKNVKLEAPPETVKRPRGWNLRRKEKAAEPAPEPKKEPAKRRAKKAALATADAAT